LLYEPLTLASRRKPPHTTPIDRMNEKARYAPNAGQPSHICRPYSGLQAADTFAASDQRRGVQQPNGWSGRSTKQDPLNTKMPVSVG
jgi:hypothetical protein